MLAERKRTHNVQLLLAEMAKRARESVAAEAAAAAPPPAKKKKNAPRRYYCSSCDADKTDKSFPDYNPSPDCDHLINTCKNCLKQWVNVQVEGGLHVTGGEGDADGEKVFGIKCVECPGIMRAVSRVVSFAFYRRLTLRALKPSSAAAMFQNCTIVEERIATET